MQTNLSRKYEARLLKAHTPPTRGSTTEPSPRVVITGREVTDVTTEGPTPGQGAAPQVTSPKPPSKPVDPAVMTEVANELKQLSAKITAGAVTSDSLVQSLQQLVTRLAAKPEGAPAEPVDTEE